MLSFEEIQERLQDRNLKMVSDRTGVPYRTVWRYAREEIEDPSHRIVALLSEYLTDGKEEA